MLGAGQPVFAAAVGASYLANHWYVGHPLAQLVLAALQQLVGWHVVTDDRRLARPCVCSKRCDNEGHTYDWPCTAMGANTSV